MPTSEGYNGAYSGPQIDAAIGSVRQNADTWSGKQDKLTGSAGQVVGFDAEGNAQAQAKPSYTAADVGAVPTSRTVNGKALSQNISLTADDVGARPETWTPTAADVGAVPTSRTVNGKALTANITLTAADVSAVPTNRTVNGQPLSQNITLDATDVGALPLTGGTLTGNLNGKYFTGTWLQTTAVTEYTSSSYKGVAILDGSGWVYYRTLAHFLADIGAVPTSRTINGQALSANVTLNATDVGAATEISGTATLPATGWTNQTSSTGYYYRNVTISGIQSSDEPSVGIKKSFSDSDADDAMQEAWNLIDGANAYSGYIRFYAKEVPSVSVSFQWKVVR